MKKACGCIAAILYPLWGLYGVGLHLFTVLIAYQQHGFGGAFLTFLMPIISQIYWLVRVAAVNPDGWGNNYTFYCLAWVLGAVVMLVCAYVATNSNILDKEDL